MSALSRAREALRGLLRLEREDAEMDEELRFHLEMEAERLEREEGLPPHEARRRAAIAFGGVEKAREEVREARGLSWVNGLSLDAKLGLRMLAKYPGLSLVGVLGMAVAIAISAAVYAVVDSLVATTLPLDEGERVVALDYLNTSSGNNEGVPVRDFEVWREGLRSVEDLSAFRNIGRNLVVPGGTAEPVRIAEMTASGFAVARIPPLLGRPLLGEDEQPGASPVVVIGYEEWSVRFGSDPNVVGREVRIGGVVHTVVGVMPEGYGFPVNHHYWVPLRVAPAEQRAGENVELTVFGRLAPGSTLEGAGAELAALGRSVAEGAPEEYARLRPRVIPYVSWFNDGVRRWHAYLVQVALSLLLVGVAVNVGVLVYARTATREGEIAVRTALGATRRRIVAQLFAEAFVLSALAAGTGLLIAFLVLRLTERVLVEMGMARRLPFWMEIGLSPSAVVYTLALTILGAVVVGVVPGLRATGSGLQSRLRSLGGGAGMRMGKTWTILIISQVAFAVGALPVAGSLAWDALRSGLTKPGYGTDEFLAAGFALDPAGPQAADREAAAAALRARYGENISELVRRIGSDPAVSHVTFASATPGLESMAWVEVEGGPGGPPSGSEAAVGEAAVGRSVTLNRVDPGLFQAFGIQVLAGRALVEPDADRSANAVIVNEWFAQRVLGGANPLGRRFRYARFGGDGSPAGLDTGRWYEVVGVVPDFPNATEPDRVGAAKVYHAMRPGDSYPFMLLARMRGGDPAAFIPRLRELAAEVDPALRLHEASPLDRILSEEQEALRLGALGFGVVAACVLLFSAAGIYALMSFTVTRRRREIGIRSALGARPGRIVTSIFAGAARQLGIGVAAGAVATLLLHYALTGQVWATGPLTALPVVAAVMLLVGALATLGPARRGLRIQPMEALREE